MNVILVYILQVAEELHQRANKKEPDKYDFINLASRVEEFTLRFLDPLNYDAKNRKMFFNNPETKDLVITAIKYEQKKVILKQGNMQRDIILMTIYWQLI